MQRDSVVNLVNSWVGKSESNGGHKEIVDIYNSLPKDQLPRGIKMQYNWPWCACTWSALAVKLGLTKIMPIEISCGFLVDKAKEMGVWKEEDFYVPKCADAVLYDWQDSGVGDNTGWPDHVGPVTYVNKNSGYFVVTEGNCDDSVKKRTVLINGRFIRGFITPKYDTEDLIKPSNICAGKDLKTVAHEVIVGIWGNGEERKSLLTTCGYDYEEVRKEVNRILNGSADIIEDVKPDDPSEAVGIALAPCYARAFDNSISGIYRTTANLNCRIDAGTNKKSICVIPKGSDVRNYGFYTANNGVRWYLVRFTSGNTRYEGFCSSKYLQRV